MFRGVKWVSSASASSENITVPKIAPRFYCAIFRIHREGVALVKRLAMLRGHSVVLSASRQESV